MKRLLLPAIFFVLLLALFGCGGQDSSSKPKQSVEARGHSATENNQTSTGGGAGRNVAVANVSYDKVSDDTGAVSVEVPVSWNERRTGEAWPFEGEVVGPSVTASTSLDGWERTGGVPGTFVLASSTLAQRYTDDQLLDASPNDFSSTCEAGVRTNFRRGFYTGREQRWSGCFGKDSSYITVSAAKPGRGCVVMAQVGFVSGRDEEGAQHVLDTFDADCSRVASYSPPAVTTAQTTPPPTTTNESSPQTNPPSTTEQQKSGFEQFVGDWSVHGAQMTIRPDFTGVMSTNAGPCILSSENSPMCNEVYQLNFSEAPSGGIVATVTSDGYETWEGNPPPPGSEQYRNGQSFLQVGDSFTLEFVDNNLLRGTAFVGNPYWCNSQTSIENRPKCGA